MPVFPEKTYHAFPVLLLLCYGTSCYMHKAGMDPGSDNPVMIAAAEIVTGREAGNEEDARLEANLLVDEIRRVGTVNSLLIRKSGELIMEQYFDSMKPGQPANIKSASKSILSLLVGIAIDKGFLAGVDQTLGSFFPDYFDHKPDPEKASITIQDLLTMRSGLQTTSFVHYKEWVSSSDWVRFVLDRPLVYEKGERMVYSTGTSHLLSVILTRATGRSTLEFANRYLFGPMDIEIGSWVRDPQGYYLGGNDLAIKPEDMLKIGRLVMDMGSYNGKRLVPEAWISESFAVYTRSPYSHYDYGYMWWSHQIADYHVTFAWGYAGQYIMMFPELDTVVAITSDLTGNNGSREYQDRIFSFVETSLIPWLEK